MSPLQKSLTKVLICLFPPTWGGGEGREGLWFSPLIANLSVSKNSHCVLVCLLGFVNNVRSLRYRPIVIHGLESLVLKTMADVRGILQYLQNEYIVFKKFMPRFSGTGLLSHGYTCNLNERRKRGGGVNSIDLLRKWEREGTLKKLWEDQQEDSIHSEPIGEEENNIANETSSLGQKQLKGKREEVQAWRQIRHENTKSNRLSVSGWPQNHHACGCFYVVWIVAIKFFMSLNSLPICHLKKVNSNDKYLDLQCPLKEAIFYHAKATKLV